MYCTKCGNKNETESRFCFSCGSQVRVVEETMVAEKTPVEKKVSPAEKAKAPQRSWLLWWDVDEKEVERQVEGYDTLSITQSARGQSVLCLMLSVVITFIFINIGSSIVDKSAYIDIVLFLILALFIYQGQKWAMIGAMVLWTLEKVYFISTGGTAILMQIIWWLVYMSAFWLAYQVELKRIELRNDSESNG
ncbi:MAG: zinc ribbon domain-containing protein [Candidatus Pacebacteria bacterium]|nr:zinc ribbon domain-containing protein [Candidatus Paceibacterota bacterium]